MSIFLFLLFFFLGRGCFLVGFCFDFFFGLLVSVIEMEEGSFNLGIKLFEVEIGVFVEVGEVEDDGDW